MSKAEVRTYITNWRKLSMFKKRAKPNKRHNELDDFHLYQEGDPDDPLNRLFIWSWQDKNGVEYRRETAKWKVLLEFMKDNPHAEVIPLLERLNRNWEKQTEQYWKEHPKEYEDYKKNG